MIHKLMAVSFAAFLLTVACGSGSFRAVHASEAEETEYNLLYVPTGDKVVAEMIRVAGVSKGDTVYDLGCGDGRIVIECAKLGARGVGVDLNPERISESVSNAKKAKVTDRVRFMEQDIFKTDFRDADVLMIYLLPDVTMKLRPRILRDLKPGTRVVSHDFDMDDWQPDLVTRVDGSDTVYYWVVPANVTGVWKWNGDGGEAKDQHVLKLNQKFQEIDGTLEAGGTEMLVKDARLSGERIEFTVVRNQDGRMVPVRFSGVVKGNVIKGVVETGVEKKEKTGWNAKRIPSTVTALD